MQDEIQLISDGDGLAVIGEPSAVERFLVSEGLQPQSQILGLSRLSSLLFGATDSAEVASLVAEGSGRWVQLAPSTMQALAKHGSKLMVNSQSHLQMGVVRAGSGKIQNIAQFTQGPGLTSMLTNPAFLAGVGGIMAQMAIQHAMQEIKDYLDVIDGKVDDVLRAQKDSAIADMIGVDLIVEEAMTVRAQVGRVSDVTWSKVQGTALTIARTQSYVLRELDALAQKLENKSDMTELATISKEAESIVREWLAVLARCVELQDALAILELDRVLDASPDELNQHSLGLKAARKHRVEIILRSVEHLTARLDAAASRANTNVLLHPMTSRSVVRSTNQVSNGVTLFSGHLGVAHDHEPTEARRWVDAAADTRDKVIETGAEGVDIAKRFGGEQLVRAKSVTDRVSSGIAERALLLRGGNEKSDPMPDEEG